MSVPQSVLDALHQTIEGLEVAGFDLDVNIEGDRLGMKVVPTAAACEDCLVPKTMFIQMVTDELTEGGHHFAAVDVSYPADLKNSG